MKKKVKILVVDDDGLSLASIYKVLSIKYSVIAVESGTEALQAIFEGNVPDLLLLDTMLPEMKGWDFFLNFRAISLLHDVPIAVMNSLDGEEEKKHARELGADDYIVKPFKENELFDKIDSMLKAREKRVRSY